MLTGLSSAMEKKIWSEHAVNRKRLFSRLCFVNRSYTQHLIMSHLQDASRRIPQNRIHNTGALLCPSDPDRWVDHGEDLEGQRCDVRGPKLGTPLILTVP